VPVLLCTGLLLVGVFLGVAGVATILTRHWSGTKTVVILAIVALVAAVFVSFTFRLLMVGTYVGDEGVRVRRALRTVQFSWSAVLSVRSQKITRMISGPLLMVTARQACLDLIDGQTIELPIQGVMRGEDRPWRMPDILSAAEFDRLLAELRHLTATHVGRSELHVQGVDPVAE
jgi:hypothetical protein